MKKRKSTMQRIGTAWLFLLTLTLIYASMLTASLNVSATVTTNVTDSDGLIGDTLTSAQDSATQAPTESQTPAESQTKAPSESRTDTAPVVDDESSGVVGVIIAIVIIAAVVIIVIALIPRKR